MTWDEFLVKRENFLGQDMLTKEVEGCCRGPIEYVVSVGDHIKFRLKWMATSVDMKTWTLIDGTNYLSANMKISTVREYCELFIIDVPYLGSFSILPKGDHLSKTECELL